MTATTPTITDRADAAARACCVRCRGEHLALIPCGWCILCPTCGQDPRDCSCHLTDDTLTYVTAGPEAEAAFEAEWHAQVAANAAGLVAAGVEPDLARLVAEQDLGSAYWGDSPPY